MRKTAMDKRRETLIWVVGGLLCAIVSIALSMQDRG